MTLADYLDGGPIDPPDINLDVDTIIADAAQECAESPADAEMDAAYLWDCLGRQATPQEWHSFTCQRRAAILRIEDELDADKDQPCDQAIAAE